MGAWLDLAVMTRDEWQKLAKPGAVVTDADVPVLEQWRTEVQRRYDVLRAAEPSTIPAPGRPDPSPGEMVQWLRERLGSTAA